VPTASQVIELLEAAEAKAYYGLAINWKPLEALSTALLERGVLQGKEVGGGAACAGQCCCEGCCCCCSTGWISDALLLMSAAMDTTA
jgi:hypothetical protein